MAALRVRASAAPGVPVKVEPTEEEMAAIVAAYQALARPVVVVAEPGAAVSPAWRFSGRWWSRPVPSRRVRPG